MAKIEKSLKSGPQLFFNFTWKYAPQFFWAPLRLRKWHYLKKFQTEKVATHLKIFLGVLQNFWHGRNAWYKKKSTICLRTSVREGRWEGPTPSGWSGRCQEGSVSWAICTHLACFSHVFSLECLETGLTCGQDDPLPGRLPTPDFVDGGILMGKMAFQKDNGLAKVVAAIQLGTLNVSPPVRITPFPHRLQLQTQ